MHHHTSKLAVVLILCAALFVACAVGITTSYSRIAVAAGMLLVFFMTCGFFYATLHLSKIS